jgi:hypothetical protein
VTANDEHTYEYPSWWSGATTVRITLADLPNNPVSAAPSAVEFLPTGVAVNVTGNVFFTPWWRVALIEKTA